LQATGLALPGADLDVVVLGANTELQNPASGYSHEARQAISGLLEVASLFCSVLVSSKFVKACLRLGTNTSRVCADGLSITAFHGGLEKS
jgi:hypothetical protein